MFLHDPAARHDDVDPAPQKRGVALDGSVDDRSPTELGLTLHATDDAPAIDLGGDAKDQRPVVADTLEGQPILLGEATKLVGLDRWTPEGMVGAGSIGVLKVHPVGQEGRT